jgi:hypothetical protein
MYARIYNVKKMEKVYFNLKINGKMFCQFKIKSYICIAKENLIKKEIWK